MDELGGGDEPHAPIPTVADERGSLTGVASYPFAVARLGAWRGEKHQETLALGRYADEKVQFSPAVHRGL